MGSSPSVPADASRSVQVIAAGFSRTGTLSMATALERLLEGPVLHGGTQIVAGKDAYVKLWIDILVNRDDKQILMKLLRDATAGFVAITDAPAILFLPELVELYPRAKVVLVTRDPDQWFRSMSSLMRKVAPHPLVLRVLLWPCPTWRWFPLWIQYIGDVNRERIGAISSKDYILRFNDWVRNNVPADNMITMELPQGWEPLAEFLDRPVPNEPFPRANESAILPLISRKIYVTAGVVWAIILSGAGVLAWSGRGIWKSAVA